jgi:hypothetical protein
MGCIIVVKSITVMMVKCADCRHTWATDLDRLHNELQDKVRAVLHED